MYYLEQLFPTSLNVTASPVISLTNLKITVQIHLKQQFPSPRHSASVNLSRGLGIYNFFKSHDEENVLSELKTNDKANFKDKCSNTPEVKLKRPIQNRQI